MCGVATPGPPMKSPAFYLVCSLLSVSMLLLYAETVSAEQWPQFRGPTGQGMTTAAKLPVEWSTESNIVWKTSIPGLGWSSPVVWDDRIYLTSAVPVSDGESNDQLLVAIAIDARLGTLLWQRTVFEQTHDATPAIHGKNSHASPTPVTDGTHLFVHYGPQGTACLNSRGDVLWQNRELKYNPQHGNGGSPVLVGDLLVVSCDGIDRGFVASLDRASGKVRWRTDRPEIASRKKFSFGTPLVLGDEWGRQIVCPGTDHVVAYDPVDGRQLWQFDYEGYSVVPRPVFGNGILYLSTSYDQPTLYALRLKADHSTPEVMWQARKGAPHTPSPLLVDGLLYYLSDRGVMTCAEALTGETVWVERIGGNYSASPLFGSGNIYCQNEDGGAVVLREGREFREVGRNALPGRSLASYGVYQNRLLIRTDSTLYCVGH